MPDRIVQDNGHNRWCDCLDCRTAWEEWHEAEYALRLLAAEDDEVRQAEPASDAEWAAFMDAEFPRAKEGMA